MQSETATSPAYPVMVCTSEQKKNLLDESLLKALALARVHIAETDDHQRFVRIINMDHTNLMPEAWLGKKASELSPSCTTSKEIERKRQEAMETGKPIHVMLNAPFFRLPDYERSEVTIVPRYDSAPTQKEKIIGATTVVVDVTERTKHMEQINRELQTANKAKSEFLSMMSHEIRTPLNGIIGMLQLLSETISDKTDEQKEYMKLIERSGRSLLHTMDGMLNFCTLEACTIRLDTIPFDLHQLLKEALSLCQNQADYKQNNNCFILEYDDRLSKTFCGDGNRIFQVIMNLLVNSNKFTRDGQIRVKASQTDKCQLSHKPTDIPATCLKISVQDTGIGIKKEFLPHLFEPFRQQEGHKKVHQGGTGLGLAICKKLIEAMKGKITVTSEEGKGSEFVVYLHLPQTSASSMTRSFGNLEEFSMFLDESKQDHGAASTADEKTSSFVPITGMAHTLSQDITVKQKIEKDNTISQTITTSLTVRTENESVEQLFVLIAEDNDVNRKILQYMLTKLKVSFLSVENGKQALDIVFQKRQNLSLILMDCFMPVMDGCEATQAIREWEKQDTKRGHLPIVATTGDVTEDYTKRGMDAILTKPIDLKRLTNIFIQFGILKKG